jgi:hypothetical protein
MNVVDLILRPRKEVKAALSNPNMGLTVLLNLLPAVLSTVVFLLVGIGFNITGLGVQVVNTFASTIIIALAIFLVGLIFAKNKVPGKLPALLNGVSLVWLTAAILMILIALLYFTVPGLLPVMQERAKGIITTDKMIEKLGETIDASALFFSVVAGVVLTLAWMVHSFIVWFLVLEESFKFSRLKHIGLFILAMVIAFIVLELKFTLLF